MRVISLACDNSCTLHGMKIFALLGLLVLFPFTALAQDDYSGVLTETFTRAKVMEIVSEEEDTVGGIPRTVQTVRLRITEGSNAGHEFLTENGILDSREDMRISEGEILVMRMLTFPDGSVRYFTAEKYRLPNIGWLVLLFLAFVFILGGWTGLSSMLGLAVSILVLVLFIVPQIASGGNPLLISLTGSFAIACTSLYLAHGFHRRTSVALLSTLLTLCIAAVLSVTFVYSAKLFGMGSEESMFLQLGTNVVNLRGLLLGGIIIGCLGVLDDITTAQTAAVDEIRKANPSLSSVQLLKAGTSVGKEHIASLINTLALAYAGASLPLLLLFHTNDAYPFWVTLNGEFLAEEIVRTLVGSTTLLFAVPISTWCAVKFLKNDDGRSLSGHHH